MNPLLADELMNCRTFLISSGIAGIGALISNSASGSAVEPESDETFSWNAGQLQFEFSADRFRPNARSVVS